ncbi:hypothetical protein LTR62_000182 [Meristemomyces frigidus]|uniref:Translation initiation factor eIF2B subunit delta n=1 Tax=Meristemomyces frigidus TaxID=1508187 RepID=A0AAN7TXL5_9PEZI|nr:hypothetical protein LTR62_000182 [Meristemomyces frigidus]
MSEQPKTGETPATAVADESKLSPAELKKRAKAEKQARRAAQREDSGVAPIAGLTTNGMTSKSQDDRQDQGPKVKTGEKQSQPRSAWPQPQKQAQKGSADAKNERAGPSQALPSRRRPSQVAITPKPIVKKEKKDLDLFSHLSMPRRHDATAASKDVHPAILALGFQYSTYSITGSSARCAAMLSAFRQAVSAYSCPRGNALALHLTPHYLSPQIEYLKSCRPLSESMGNAIRWLKKLIAETDPDLPEDQAKAYLCEEMERFSHERILVSGKAIATSAAKRIESGSVVLTFAKSWLVEKTILQAYNENGVRNFRVVVVDSRPLYEGRKLAESLAKQAMGLEVEYVPYSGLQHAVKEATLVLLGAHSMLSNGRLLSRCGTAGVAMQAHRRNVPIIVLSESVKFSGKVALDSIVLNEAAPADELMLPEIVPQAGGAASTEDDDDDMPKLKRLKDWKDIPNLQVLNLMYDVTAAEYISMVICEYGSVPPSSVPVVHGMVNAMEV